MEPSPQSVPRPSTQPLPQTPPRPNPASPPLSSSQLLSSSPRLSPAARSSPRPGGAVPTGALQDDNLHALILRLDRRCQHLLDRVAPFQLQRWVGLAVLLALFMLRVFLLEGFYIVVYVLFIYILNQFILFLQPKHRAELVAKAAAREDDSPPLPTLDDEEFRPFVRRLPEFRFWYSTTFATVIAVITTFFTAFDVPVFWPVLLFYSVVLFVATMRRQWLDMKKLKYVPWDIGNKKVYKSDPKRVSVTAKPNPASAHPSHGSRAPPPPVPTIPVSASSATPSVASAGPAAVTPNVSAPVSTTPTLSPPIAPAVLPPSR